MKIALLLLTSLFLSGGQMYSAENKDYSMKLSEEPQTVKTVGLKLDISDTDNASVISQSTLEQLVKDKLASKKFSLENSSKGPYLLLRINNLAVKGVIASFIQLSYHEPATLKRTNQSLDALTWSNASLLASETKDTKSEVEKTVSKMLDEFMTEYDVAYKPQE